MDKKVEFHNWLLSYRMGRGEVPMDLQQRPPQHGHRRDHASTETENGRVSSTNAPR